MSLNSTSFSELETGWISPGGEFYPTEYMEHIATARELYWELYKDEYIPNDVDEVLLDHGWLEIQMITYLDHGYLFHFRRHLTAEQIRSIKATCEANMHRIIKSNRSELQEEFER